MPDNPDSAGDWPIHALTDEKLREQQASIKRALEWQQQEAEALASACKYLNQAAQGITPHD
jgi:hypothetical protein